jgi:hypothetical protein
MNENNGRWDPALVNRFEQLPAPTVIEPTGAVIKIKEDHNEHMVERRTAQDRPGG